MKKQDLKAFIKNKGVYITLILGALIIVAVLSINKSLSDDKQEKNGLVDLNESPDIALNNDFETNQEQSDDNNQFSQMDNDALLEYDSYLGTNPYQNHGDLSMADNSGTADITDSSAAGGEGSQAEDTQPVQPAGTSSIADEPDDKASGTNEDKKNESEDEGKGGGNEEAETKQDASDTVNDHEDLTQVSAISAADLSFSPEEGLMWPVKGNVILGYSADHAIYHATLLQFKVNPAILISAHEKSEVKASKTGIITDISETPQTGITVTIEIGDGYSLVYGQLADVRYEIGDLVEEGEVFAVINKVSKYYSVEGDHLYFQVRSGEGTMNPMLLLNDE